MLIGLVENRWAPTDGEKHEVNFAVASLDCRLPGFADILSVERVAAH